MTAAPHSIATAHSWRSIPISPIATAETAAIFVFALIVVGVMAVHARAAMQSAQASAAASEIRILGPVVDAYALDHSGYAGMTPAALEQDYGVQLDSATVRTLQITGTSTTSYCVQIRDGALYAAQQGPTGAIETSQTPICR
jgi:hypothetical protein